MLCGLWGDGSFTGGSATKMGDGVSGMFTMWPWANPQFKAAIKPKPPLYRSTVSHGCPFTCTVHNITDNPVANIICIHNKPVVLSL